jgi:hypothetical protein
MKTSIRNFNPLFACIALITPFACVSLGDNTTTIPLPFQYNLRSPINTSRTADPIAPLADRMGDVVTDLSAMKTDQPVQTKQKQIDSLANHRRTRRHGAIARSACRHARLGPASGEGARSNPPIANRRLSAWI